MTLTTRRVSILAFLVGVYPIVVAPFAILSGFEYVLEYIGIYKDPHTARFHWGIGGILYCLALPVWIGYLWTASSKRTELQLQRFWMASISINAIWVIFFLITLMRPEDLSTPAPVWIAYSLFPLILLPLSLYGMRLAKIGDI